MKDAKYRWLLEQEVDGEVSTFPETTELSKPKVGLRHSARGAK